MAFSSRLPSGHTSMMILYEWLMFIWGEFQMAA